MKRPRILVVGSINMDLFVEGANAIPGYGESIRADIMVMLLGRAKALIRPLPLLNGSRRSFCRMYRR